MATQLPQQVLPESKKDSAWIKENTDAIISMATINSSEREEDNVCWDLYHGLWPQNTFDYLRKVDKYEYPAMVRHIPIQRPRIDLLLGQELNRPINIRIYCTNRDRVLMKEESMKGQIHDKYLDQVVNRMIYANQLQKMQSMKEQYLQQAQQMGDKAPLKQIAEIELDLQRQQKPLQQLVKEISKDIDDVQRHYNFSFRDELELGAEKMMKYMIEEGGLHHKFLLGFTDSVVTGKERYYVELKHMGAPPIMHKLNSSRLSHSADENAVFLQDCNWIKFDKELSMPEILDEFPELQLQPENLKLLSDMINDIDPQANIDYSSGNNNSSIDNCDINGPQFSRLYQQLRSSPAKHTVHYTFWKSSRRVNIKESLKPNDPNVKFTHWVEDKEIGDGTGMRYKYLEDIYMSVRIGGSVYVRGGKMRRQYRSISAPGKAQMPFFGFVYNQRSRRPYSLVKATKDIQLLFNIVNYHYELMLAIAGGKGTIMDKAQIPKDMKTSEWSYQKKMGTVWINSAQTYNGMKPTFNQFGAFDDTVSPAIQYLAGIMDKLEDLCGNAIGISRQRLGQLNADDPVGTSKLSSVQSSMITEIKFYEHDLIKKQVLTYMINLAKISFKEGFVGQIVVGNMGQEIINIAPNTMNLADYGMFLTDSTKEIRALDDLRQLASMGMKAGTVDFKSLIRAYRFDSVIELEKSLEYYTELQEQKVQANEQNRIAAEQQVQAQAEKMKAQIEEQKLGLQQAMNDIKAEEIRLSQEQADKRLELDRMISDNTLSLERDKIESERISEAANLAEDRRQADMEFRLKQLEIEMKMSQSGGALGKPSSSGKKFQEAGS